MYKKIIPSLFALLCSTPSFAQAPILTAGTTNPFWGDIYVNVVCDPTSVSQGPSGANQMWIFSGLVPSATTTPNSDTGTAVACDKTPNCISFFGANTAISATGAVTYYNMTDTKLQQLGYWGSPTQHAIYTDPADQFHYPFTYLSTFVDPCAGMITYTPSSGPTINAFETSTVTTTCDGYGTLYLPGGLTYPNVLRIHTSQSFRDSADLFGTPTVQTYILESYTWYTPGYHSALLTISTATGLYNYKLVSYSAGKLKTSVPEFSSLNKSLELFPNPAKGELNVRFNVAGSDQVRVSLVDLLGREVGTLADKYVHGEQNIAYNTSGLASGLYVLRLQAGSETVTRKVEIQ